MCDDAVNLPVPEEATVVGYGDDIVLVVVEKHIEYTELYLCQAIGVV